MVLLPAVLSCLLVPVTFEERPVAAAVAEGSELFRRKKDPSSIWKSDRVGVGTWFNGRKKQTIEEIYWISPLAVSRRLGYLKAQEGWSEARLQQRWEEARAYFGKRLTFVSRLCSFPKNEIFEDVPSPSQVAFEPIAPTLCCNGKVTALDQTLLEDRAGQCPMAALANWLAHPAFDPLRGALDAYDDPGFLTGPYESRLLMLTCDAIPEANFKVILASYHKQRTAAFSTTTVKVRNR